MEFNDVASADEVLKQQDWELEGRSLYIQRANSGGGSGSSSGGGDGGGRSKFQST